MQSNDLLPFPVPEAEARLVLVADEDANWRDIWLSPPLLAQTVYDLGSIYADAFPSFTEFALKAMAWYGGGENVPDLLVRSLYGEVLLEQLTDLPLHLIGHAWCQGPPADVDLAGIECYGLTADLPWPREMTALTSVVVFAAKHREGARREFQRTARVETVEIVEEYEAAGVDLFDWTATRIDLDGAARKAARTRIDLLRNALLGLGHSGEVAEWLSLTVSRRFSPAQVRRASSDSSVVCEIAIFTQASQQLDRPHSLR